jgi:hypothetical protein
MTALKAGRPSRDIPARTLAKLSNEETVRMNANVPKSLYRRMRQRALDEETTVTELLIKLCNEYLSK